MMLVHMAVITERALDSRNEDYASKLTLAQSLFRKVAFVAALFFFWRVLKIDLLAAVLGAMGMKAGAYLQPLVRKISGYQEEPAKALEQEKKEDERIRRESRALIQRTGISKPKQSSRIFTAGQSEEPNQTKEADER